MTHTKIIILTFLLFNLSAIGQDREEYKIHLHSIDTISNPKYIDKNIKADSAFIQYTINYLLSKSSDIKYISNRKLLPKIKQVSCDSLNSVFYDTLLTGEICSIRIYFKRFNANAHKVEYNEKAMINKSIDGLFPYGGVYGNPEIEIEKMEIVINSKTLNIPKESFQNLYNPNICYESKMEKKLESYTSIDGKYIYIYFSGGNAAGTYLAKLVFDKEKYITKIIADYYSIASHAGFRQDFNGF